MSLWADQPCSDLHLYDISRLIAEWRDIAPALGLTEVEENTVMRDAYTQPAQRLAMLRTWKKKHGVLATYRSLADAFTRCGRQDLVDIVTDLVRETGNTAGERLLSSWPWKRKFILCIKPTLSHLVIVARKVLCCMVVAIKLFLQCVLTCYIALSEVLLKAFLLIMC